MTTERATGDTCAPCTAILGSPSACAISHDFRLGYGDLAAEIAARFGETGERPRAQIARMIGLMGAEWVREQAEIASAVLGRTAPRSTWIVVMSWTPERGVAAQERADGTPRTPAGVFFQVAREEAVRVPTMEKRAFYSTFCWREPQPRTPKPPPVKASKLPRMPAGASVTAGNVRRQPARAAAPEVYVVRGRGAGR
jgi:hypothetical protein